MGIMSHSDIVIQLATGNYDRVRPLVEDRVSVPGVRFAWHALPPSALFPRALAGEFDVFELSASAWLTGLAQGRRDWVGIPVFISRAFRHSGIYIRSDRGIREPADLRGRRVGVPDYAMTGAVWLRGILQDEYDVRPDQLQWVTGGLHEAGHSVLGAFTPPEGLQLTQIPGNQTLSDWLADGQIDAMFSSEPPQAYTSGQSPVTRLFPDYRQVEQQYYRKHGLHPIMHVLVIRRPVLERLPDLPVQLFRAFEQSKAYALGELSQLSGLRVTLPWVGAAYEDARRVLGEDIWPYGIEANRRELETLRRYLREQGLAQDLPEIDEAFADFAGVLEAQAG